jgi:F-type H+-transporting ATPase subunit delta
MTDPGIRSASRQALESLREEENSVYDGKVSANDLVGIAAELYAVADLLTGQPRLRRTLGDPATSADGRAGLVESLLSGKVGKQALQLVASAVRLRWSSPWDLTDAIEDAGDTALFAAADKQKSLDQVEDDLFRLERILDSEGDVAALLDEFTVDAERRTGLLDTLVADKVTTETLALLRHAVASQRKRNITLAIDDLLAKAAARRNRSIARVISAVPLSDAQQQRLAAVLSEMYGRAISVRVALDPDVVGGLVVHVGDEVIDGSIATRFAQARAALAS